MLRHVLWFGYYWRKHNIMLTDFGLEPKLSEYCVIDTILIFIQHIHKYLKKYADFRGFNVRTCQKYYVYARVVGDFFDV